VDRGNNRTMAEEPNKNAEPEESEPTAEASPTAAKPSFLARLMPRKWIVLMLALSVVNFGIGFGCCRLLIRPPAVTTSPEVSLGVFSFHADPGELGSLADAQFSLHIALLDHVDQLARNQLETHQFRLRQDIEELLRQAHSGDFEDPKLGGLKRQLQEQVNQTLGMRVIADVIITDLQLNRSGNAPGTPVQAANVPWAEPPSELAGTSQASSGH
jgi:flagellar basal body-associated protein FliL